LNRTAAIIKKWVERHHYDFETPEMDAQLQQVLEVMKTNGFDNIVQQIQTTFTKHVRFLSLILILFYSILFFLLSPLPFFFLLFSSSFFSFFSSNTLERRSRS